MLLQSLPTYEYISEGPDEMYVEIKGYINRGYSSDVTA